MSRYNKRLARTPKKPAKIKVFICKECNDCVDYSDHNGAEIHLEDFPRREMIQREQYGICKQCKQEK